MKRQKKLKNREIPAPIKNIEQWQLSRRNFVKSLLSMAAISQLPLLTSCINPKEKVNNTAFGQLNEFQKNILKEVQITLFPDDGNGPSAVDINALNYLQWVISDTEMDPIEVKYIIDGISWVEETAQEEYAISFLKLSSNKKNFLITRISLENWGENWLSVILTFIFEALISDPQYGGNSNSIGWKWLQYNPGYPRPTTDLLYNKILETIRS